MIEDFCVDCNSNFVQCYECWTCSDCNFWCTPVSAWCVNTDE